MSDEIRYRKRSVDFGALIGPIWFAGWLFCIGFLKLAFWKAVLGLVLWPYYLGAFFSK
jgi:hypothetical protein